MILDLHNHSIRSDDGKAKVENYCQWIRKRELGIDGFVLTEILDDDFEAANPVTYIDTYEREPAASGEAPETEEVDDAIREKLRSLGYIQ